MDFTIVCRICLASNKETSDIYTCLYAKRNVLYCEMISACTKLKPSVEDGLPRRICKECCKQLKRTFTFNLLCEASDEKLKFYLGNPHKAEVCNSSTLEPIESKNELEENVKSETEADNDTLVKYELLRDDDFQSFDITDLKEDIKDEPEFNGDGAYDSNGSDWDAEDNTLLENIKIQKKENRTQSKKKRILEQEGDIRIKRKYVRRTSNSEVIIKKKRGPKRRVVFDSDGIEIPASKVPHQCDICGKFLSTKSNLKAHKICHTDLRPYKCAECPATFRGHSALFTHKRKHSGETPYQCEFCPKKFSRRTGLVSHTRLHTGEKLFSCAICPRNFTQSSQLNIHMKRHKGDKNYLCQECGKGFPIKGDLKVHQRIHNGEKPYQCPMCPKKFTTSGNLGIHVRIHNQEIRYTCKACHRGFVTRSAYNVHLKRHKGQKDYICECGKTFYTSSALKQHKVVHTGEKKYQCKFCDRKFTQTGHLSRHFKRDHLKPNETLPSPDYFKIILREGNRKNVFDNVMQKKTANSAVKCEESQGLDVHS